MPIFYIVGGPGLLIKEQLQLGYNNIDTLRATFKCWIGRQPAKVQAHCSMIEFYQSTDLPMAPLYVVFKDLDLAKLLSSPPVCHILCLSSLKAKYVRLMACGAWSQRHEEHSAARASAAWGARMSSGTDEGTLSQSMRRRCLNKVKKIAGYNKMANILQLQNHSSTEER